MEGPDPETAAALAALAGCRIAESLVLPDGSWAHRIGCTSHATKVRFLDLLAEWDALQPEVRRTAERIAAGALSRLDQIAKLHRMVRDGIVHTPELREQFSPPLYVLRTALGDCDDAARALMALLRSLGFKVRPATLGNPPAHVATQVRWGPSWWWLETTIPAHPGEHPLAAARRLGIETRKDITG